VAVAREQIVALLEEVFAGLRGLKGVHCCGNTDWALVLETSLDILNFDAYNFAETLALYPTAVRAFLRRGGFIAWGIVPAADAAQVLAETADRLVARLEAAWRTLAGKGVPFDDLVNAALITPACGLGTLGEPAAERALALAAEVSQRLRWRYFPHLVSSDQLGVHSS
jgi:methionine synthase II (cobalamin-independent)